MQKNSTRKFTICLSSGYNSRQDHPSASDMTASAPTEQPIETTLQQAIEAHQAAQFEQAEELYLAILQAQPYHAVANHNMGLLAGQVNQFAAGLPYLHKALSVNPDEGQFWLSYANGLLQAGETAEALDIIDTAIGRGLDNEQSQNLRTRIVHTIASTPTLEERQQVVAYYQAGQLAELEAASRALTIKYPESDFAWSVLGTALQAQGKDAFEALHNTVQLAPHDAEAHGNLGMAWQERGDHAQALASYARALELNPGFVEAYGNQASALLAQGELEPAEQACRQALALRPDYVKGHVYLADTLQAMGRSAEAVVSYQQALKLQPGDAAIYLNLGNAQQDLQQWAPAVVSYRAALHLAPNMTVVYANLATALRESGDHGNAAANYRKAIAAHPDDAVLHHSLGQALQAQGKPDEAIAAYQQALAIDADYVPALSSLGLLHARQKDYPAAIACCQRAFALQPQDALACGHLAIVYGEAGERDLAIDYFTRATALAPDDVRAHMQLADYHHTLRQHELAVVAYRRALECDPDSAGVLNNLGSSLQALKQFDQAQDAYLAVLAIHPDNATTLCNLGANYQDRKQYEKAREYYQKALDVDPTLARAHFSMGNSYMLDNNAPAAVEQYRSALAVKPDYRDAYVNLSATLNNMGRLDEALEVCRTGLSIGADWDNLFSNYLFLMSHSATIAADEMFAEHVRFGATFERLTANLRAEHTNSPDPLRTLKVGLVSGDLHNHPIPHFILPVLENIAADAGLSLYAYYNDPEDDYVTERLRQLIPTWRQVELLSDEELVKLIRADGIDILIDLSGHTGKNRLRAMAAKPAPIQASWIGYPATTGLTTVDYYLSDAFFSPLGKLEEQFTEKLMLLPVCAPFLPTEYAPAIRPAPALTNGYLTFGSFNRLNKINRQVVARWARLLRAIPDARMLLAAMPTSAPQPVLLEWFTEEGIAPDRLDFEARTGIGQYMEMHHRVDICLDTFPYGGGTTTFHALWMGVPTLTIAGPTQPSRAGTSILRQVELEEFIAVDDDEYVQKGLSMAANPMLLGAYRFSARHRLERSPMGNTRLIAEGLENGLRLAWQRWCEGLPPVAFSVPVANPNPPIGL
jgi:protein O-GlcNAc transferase